MVTPNGGQPRVLIVGGGPTGLIAANLLGWLGVPTRLVEQNETISDQAKAISLDDESLRVLQRCGLLDEVMPIVLPGTGTRYYGADGRFVAHARGPVPPVHGLPVKSAFQQPELERLLRRALGRFPHVTEFFGTALTDMRQDGDGVRTRLAGPDGARELHVEYVLGCDGGRSSTRHLLGVRMTGSSFEEPWIVVDTINDPHHERYGMHHGDPRRPHVIIPGLKGHCRYEFLLGPGEALPGGEVSFELVRTLLAPYRSVTEADVVRRTVYTFHALIAERWQVGRVFLLGDAAHMMPPFAGQGLNSGVRDAANLTWKIASVLAGQASPQLLETYEPERRPHAEAMVRLSVRLGAVVMTTDAWTARVRDLLVRAARRIPRARTYIDEMRFRRPSDYGAGAVVPAKGRRPMLLGRVLPQPTVLGPSGGRRLLDEALGNGFALLAVDPTRDVLGDLRDPFWDAIGARRLELMTGERWARPGAVHPVVVDEHGQLQRPLRAHRGQVMLVRPDRYVAAIFSPVDEHSVAEWLEHHAGLAPTRSAPVPEPAEVTPPRMAEAAGPTAERRRPRGR